MDPTLIQIGSFRIAWYGLFLTLAIFGAFELAKRILKGWGFDPNRFEQIAFWAVIWGVIGARLGYVITSPAEFNANPIEALYIWRGGLSFHGGMIGGMIPLIYYARRYGAPLWPYFDAIVPGVALGIIAGRLGNFMNGSDTVGRLTTWPIGFTWPTSAVGFPGVCKGINDISEYTQCGAALVRGPVHLTQIYGVIIGIVLLALAFYWIRQNRSYGYVFWQFVLWYSVLRAGIEETFRLNPLLIKSYVNESAGIGFFTTTQVISIPLIIAAIVILARWPKGGRQAPPTPAPVPTAPTPQARRSTKSRGKK